MHYFDERDPLAPDPDVILDISDEPLPPGVDVLSLDLPLPDPRCIGGCGDEATEGDGLCEACRSEFRW